MEFTGERYIPEESNAELYDEHVLRYEFAKQFVKDKVVLDAACGEPIYDAQLEFERMMKEECDYLSPTACWRPGSGSDPSIFKGYAQKNFGFGFTFEFARFCIWDRALGKRVPISQARYRRFAKQLVHAIDRFAKVSQEKGWR